MIMGLSYWAIGKGLFKIWLHSVDQTKDTFNEGLEYNNDPFRLEEISDTENGLSGEMALADIVELNKDEHEEVSPPLTLRFPGRHLHNYDLDDSLSQYKLLPPRQ